MRTISGSHLRDSLKDGRLLNRAASILLVLWIAYEALATNVFGGIPWADSCVDYQILYRDSRSVVATHSYPPGYPYPPSSVVLQYGTALLPYTISAAVYMALTITGAIVCWRLLTLMLFERDSRWSYVLALLAYFASGYFFQWDLRSQNCNILVYTCFLYGVFLCLKVQRIKAGFWFALSVALKLFAVFTLPYLLWKNARRAVGAALLFSVVFWILLPACVFSLTGVHSVYSSWIRQIGALTHSDWYDPTHPILISLNRSMIWISTRHPGAGACVLAAIRVLWGALIIAAAELSRRREKYAESLKDPFGLLTDLSVILLAPIALSPYLEPYHPVPFAAVAILLLNAGADSGLSVRIRVCAWAAFIASTAVGIIHSPFEVRGLIVNIKLLMALSGLIWIAWARARWRGGFPPVRPTPQFDN